VDSDTALPSSAEGKISTDHDTRSTEGIQGRCHPCLEKLPSNHSANVNAVEDPSSVDVIKEQERVPLSWLNNLKSHKQRRPDPEDDDDAEYITEDEDIEIGNPENLRARSARISQQLKRAKVSEAM
jgi:hypothetical protein